MIQRYLLSSRLLPMDTLEESIWSFSEKANLDPEPERLIERIVAFWSMNFGDEIV